MNYIGQIILMAVMLICSALCSGSETAFFNISPRRKRLFRESKSKIQQTAAKLLAQPEKLLTSLLFGNMTFNVLYFTISGALTLSLQRNFGTACSLTSAAVSFFLILLFGEMLPKSLAYHNTRLACIYTTPFCLILTSVLAPVVGFFKNFIITPTIRLLTGPAAPLKTSGGITVSQFRLLIDSSHQQGHISSDETQLFSEIMDLHLLKVRHVMQPRVDMVTAEVRTPLKKLRSIMEENKLTRIPIHAKDIDNILGMVELRDMILSPELKINSLINKIKFVPEQKTIESLLEFFRRTKTDTAMVVDEYGGIAGKVSVEDCVKEILGPIDDQQKSEPIQQIGPLEYRLSANMPIHDWAESFGIDIAYGRTTTIAGLTTALLGKIPKPGDTTQIRNLKLTVENVHRHRISSIILTFENIPKGQS
jgi:putative hemolysin